MTKEDLKVLLYVLHRSTFRNEKQIYASVQCGCFHCGKLFKPEDVINWCDNDGRGDRTALCPYCDIDSVIVTQITNRLIIDYQLFRYIPKNKVADFFEIFRKVSIFIYR
ncbi:MAG: hypothetical protein J6U93_01745 [Alistipes sp.]|nr:hypothetical protein [Alistipes sp.]